MQALISMTMAICISLMLFAISPFAASVAGIAIFLAYVLVARFSMQRLQINSQIIAMMITYRTKVLQESLGGIRDIILERSQDIFERKFANADKHVRKAIGINAVIGGSPRYIVEAAGILAIVFVTINMSSGPTGFDGAIPSLGAISFGALRLLPLVQSTWAGLSGAMGNRQLLADVLEFVELPIPDQPLEIGPLIFKNKLAFEDVSFCYSHDDLTLQKISFDINKGEHIGISGITGSGKSTLLDLILGLLIPHEGRISIDGTPLRAETIYAWQKCVAQVAQSVIPHDDLDCRPICFLDPETKKLERPPGSK